MLLSESKYNVYLHVHVNLIFDKQCTVSVNYVGNLNINVVKSAEHVK